MRLGLLAWASCALFACSSQTIVYSGTPGDGGTPDPLADGGSAQKDGGPGKDGGVPSGDYPTQNIGWTPRSGSIPGSVIANLSFPGYAANATAQGTIQLADFYDPNAADYDIVALLAISAWDVITSNLVDNLVASPPSRVAVLLVLGEGTSPGTPATMPNLTTFRSSKGSQAFWNGLDPSHTKLAPLFDVAAVPLVVILDVRTMEIVSAGAGAPPNPTQTFEQAAATVRARPPSY